MKKQIKELSKDPRFMLAVALALILLYFAGGTALVDLFESWMWPEVTTTQGAPIG